MANRAYDEDEMKAMAALHAASSDYGFEQDPEDDQEARNFEFEAQWSEGKAEFDDRHVKRDGFHVDDDVEDAVEVNADMGNDGAPFPPHGSSPARDTDPLVDNYIKQVKKWRGEGVKGKNEFVNDANAIDDVRSRRLRHAQEIKDRPELIADPAMAGVQEYLKADLSYISRTDPSAGDYDKFMMRRAELRDKMFKGKPILSGDDYEKVVGRAQRMIADESHVDAQYDLIDLRKEAALEHFDDPRFVTEVYRSKKGLMDELLVDFDRKDLLASEMVNNSATRGRSLAMADTFDTQVKNNGKEFESAAEKVKNFQETREVGLNIRHNQRAIAGFADRHPKDGVHFERGMAALDNVRWSDSMWEDYGKSLPKDQRGFILKHKGPAAAFKVAREEFEKQFDAGDPKMAKSFAVMEQAASKIEKDSSLQEHLSKIGSPEDVASFHMFTEKYKEQNLGRTTTKKVDASVDAHMKASGTLQGAEHGNSVMRQGSLDKDYPLVVGKTTQVEVIDGAHVLVSNNADDLKEGKGIVMRLDGIVAPPEGVSTKSGKLDAGLESKANLEGVISRHGIANLGMRIRPSKDGGEPTIELRTADGEDVSQRMLRDGYAIPTKGSEEGNRREYMTKQAEANNRGLWRDGFPEMDQSWRREKDAPALTWRDKRMNLTKTVNDATCHTHMQVARNLSRSETKMFGLPLKAFAGSKAVDREISKVLDRNPSRIMDIYNENMETLEDLRKRKDKLSQPEKRAHDQLALGRRALGEALVSRNLIDAKQFKKDTHELMSRKGIQVSADGIRKVADATGKIVNAGAREAVKHGSKAKRGLGWLIDEAMN